MNQMKQFVYKVLRALMCWRLKRNGWVLADNVLISMHGVKKIGGG